MNKTTEFIKRIQIFNIKGIKNKIFKFDNYIKGIHPNIPNIFVAPNGFGKSSFAKAFQSIINRNKITLSEEDHYEQTKKNSPRIIINYNKGRVQKSLEANENINEIKKQFSCFVINNQVKPKGIGSRFGTATARVEIPDISICKIVKSNDKKKYLEYKKNKEYFENTLQSFNNAWLKVKLKKSGDYLVANFPQKISSISNGQRDILSFIIMLFKAKLELKKNSNILIIDEVFDYLDDANLIAVQYYISKFIDEFKTLGKNIYPIILTHLNPYYFKNFVFNKQKIFYLNGANNNIKSNDPMVQLLIYRNKKDVENFLSKYLFHFYPEDIEISEHLKKIGLNNNWETKSCFVNYTLKEKNKYLENEKYNPFAVCVAIRVGIEKNVYDKIEKVELKKTFVEITKTKDKLEFAENNKTELSEMYYFLGIIYNDTLHWKNNQDNFSPIISKLENLTIKELVKQVFNNN